MVFDQITQTWWYTTDDVEPIAPGAGFPRLTRPAPVPSTAAVQKYGGEIPVTREHKLRNNFNAVNDNLVVLRNTVVRKFDSLAIAALAAAPVPTMAGVDLTTATSAQIWAMFVAARGAIRNIPGLGYRPNTVVLNDVNADELLANENFVKLLQQDEDNPRIVRDATLGRVGGMDFYQTDLQPLGTAYVTDSGRVGRVSDEEPLSTVVYNEPHEQTDYVQAWRSGVHYVENPKAALKLTGL